MNPAAGLKIERAVSEFTRTKKRPGGELPGLLDKDRETKVAALVKPLAPRQRIPVAPAEAP